MVWSVKKSSKNLYFQFVSNDLEVKKIAGSGRKTMVEALQKKKKKHMGMCSFLLTAGSYLVIIGISCVCISGCQLLQKGNIKGRSGCLSCHHGEDRVLPGEHVATQSLDLNKCLECHHGDETRLTYKIPLGHTHQLSGISCIDCHGTQEPMKTVESGKCISCHSLEDLRDQKSGNIEANPHDSHYGPDLDCDLCHHVHQVSEDFCIQCHDFEFVVPSPIFPLSFRNQKEI